jgi:short-subunit dehydrogenase
LQLEGKQIVLTGAAGGIGSLVAVRLRAHGAHLIGVDRLDCPACDETIIADLASEAGLNSLGATLAARKVDMLINIAGFQYFGPYEQQDMSNIWLGYAVNLIAPAALIRAVLPQMIKRKSGHIVNIGSVMGSINYPFFAAYSSAKAGVRGLSEGLRREMAGRGIDVSYVAPRAVRTAFNNAAVMRFMEMTKMHPDDPEFVADRIVQAILQRRKETFIGFRERLFIRLNALFPRLIDAGLAGQTAQGRQLFPSDPS